MLFKAFWVTLVHSIFSYSLNDFSNKFCDNSSINQMIDRVLQTPTTIYIIRNSMVYPIIRKKMPLLVGQNNFWTQKRDAFSIRNLFLGVNLTDFESGFTITLDANKKFIRDFKHNSSYSYMTFIFNEQNYYLFKKLSNDSFILANNEDIPLKLENQGSIEVVFGIKAPVYGSYYKMTKIGQKSIFLVVLLSKDGMFYSYVLHKSGEQRTQLMGETKNMRIDQNYRKYRAHHIRGIVVTSLPYIILENSLIKLLEMENVSRAQRFSIWEAFDCNYFADYLPQMEALKRIEFETTSITTTTESTNTVDTKPTFNWSAIIVVTLIFVIFAFIIFCPLFALKNIRKAPKASAYLTKYNKTL